MAVIIYLIKKTSYKADPQIISKKEKEPEIKKVQKRSKKEQEEIYESHLEYVDKLAKKFIKMGWDKGLPFDDLVKGGRLGLRKAAANVDPSSNLKFSIDAYWWIREGMKSVIEAQSSIPDTITYKFQKQKKNISEADELKKFAELKDQGIITEEEFNSKKRQILDL